MNSGLDSGEPDPDMRRDIGGNDNLDTIGGGRENDVSERDMTGHSKVIRNDRGQKGNPAAAYPGRSNPN
ncbi:hypothetical protein ES703_63836 [subsurface metagenome]